MTAVWRRTSVLGLLMAGVLTLSACGGDDGSSSTGTQSAAAETTATAADSGGFCADFAGVADAIDVKLDAADPSGLGGLFTKGADALKSVQPPAEIADAWKQLTDFYEQFGVAFDNIDLNDAAGLDKVGDALSKLEENAKTIAEASESIGTYATEHC